MTSNIEMSDQARKDCADALSRVLADTYIVYLKTHNFHWNVEGPYFQALHTMFEGQYTEMWAAIDEIAERIRALGEYAPGTYAKFTKLASVKDTEELPDAAGMLNQLIEDNAILVKTLRSALAVAQEHGDEASAGLLTDRLTIHEKQLWMMKSSRAA